MHGSGRHGRVPAGATKKTIITKTITLKNINTMYEGLKEKKSPRTYLRLSGGQIVYKPQNGEEQSFGLITGTIVDVNRRDTTGTNGPVQYLDIVLRDDKGQEAVLSTQFDSGTARSLILAMANIPDMSKPIELSVWPKQRDNGKPFTNTLLRQGGEKVSWIIAPGDLPQSKPITDSRGNVVAYDSADRNEAIEGYYNAIRAKLAGVGPEDDYDDMPDDIG